MAVLTLPVLVKGGLVRAVVEDGECNRGDVFVYSEEAGRLGEAVVLIEDIEDAFQALDWQL